MIYYFKYMSKKNHACNIGVIVNSYSKKFYVYKQTLYRIKKELEVLQDSKHHYSVILVDTKADIATLINQLRQDETLEEV